MNEIYIPQPGDRVYHRLSSQDYKGTVVDTASGITHVQWDDKPRGTTLPHATRYMVLVCRPTPPATRTEVTWEIVRNRWALVVGDTVRLPPLTSGGSPVRAEVTEIISGAFVVLLSGEDQREIEVSFMPSRPSAFYVESVERQVTREVRVDLPTEPGLYVSPAFTVFQLRDNGEWWNPASNQKVNPDTIAADKHQPLNKVVSA